VQEARGRGAGVRAGGRLLPGQRGSEEGIKLRSRRGKKNVRLGEREWRYGVEDCRAHASLKKNRGKRRGLTLGDLFRKKGTCIKKSNGLRHDILFFSQMGTAIQRQEWYGDMTGYQKKH